MFTVGSLSTNCFVANCQKEKKAIVIDPGFESTYEAEQVIRYVDENLLTVEFIVNTHGHRDHISGNLVLKRKYKVPVCIHEYDAGYLNNLESSLSPLNVLLKDGSLIEFGRVSLKVMHTPGHSPGSVSLVGKKLVFTGDTLFSGGIGRTDFPGGSDRDMKFALQNLMSLPDDYFIYPGHGRVSIIGDEKRTNPFIFWL